MARKQWIVVMVIGIFFQTNVFAQKKSKIVNTGDGDYIYKIDKKELEIQNIYIDAVNEKQLGNTEDAIGLFQSVIKLDPDNHAAFYELSRLAYELKNFNESESFANKAVKLDPKNEWYYIYLAEAKSAKGDYLGAAKVYEKLVSELPYLSEYLHDIAYMYIQADKYQEAIEVYDKIEIIEGISENTIIQKQSLYVKLNKIDKAAIEVKKLVDEFPNDNTYPVLLGDLYEANGLHKKAIESYEILLKRDENNPQALLSIAEIQRKTGDETSYNATIKRVFGNKDLDIDTKIYLFIPYIESISEKPEIAEEVLEMSKLIMTTHPENAKAQTAFADVLFNSGKKEEAIEAYKKATSFAESPITVWIQLYDLFISLQDFKSLQSYAEEGVKKFPDDATPLFYAGLACAQLKDYTGAVKHYENALKFKIPNPQAVTQILSSLGDAYHNLENFEKSDSCFEQVLVINPNDAYTLNNYAYYLSLREDKLESAEKMSKRSNILVENNSSFQDTYAWIKFNLGDYKTAKEWMEKAMTNMSIDGGDRPVLLEHYGDILFKLNDINGALDNWQKALEAGGDKETLSEKIRTKALIE